MLSDEKSGKHGGILISVFIFLVGSAGSIMVCIAEGQENVVQISIICCIQWAAIILFIRHKVCHRDKFEKKADAAMEYAQKASAYNKSTAGRDNYLRRLESIISEGKKPSAYSHPDSVQAGSTSVITDEEILREYSDEYEKQRCEEKQQSLREKMEQKYSLKQKPLASLFVKLLWGLVLEFVIIFALLPTGAGIWLNSISKGENSADFINILSNGRIVLFPLTLIAVIYFVFGRKASSKISDNSVIYKKLIPRETAGFFGENSSFDQALGLPDEEICRMNCFGKGIVGACGRNLICGQYRNIDFQIAWEQLEREYTETDEDGKERVCRATAFKGLIVKLLYPKKSVYPLGLRSNLEYEIAGAYQAESRNRRKAPVKVAINGTESADFNALFNIYSADEENLYYVLTPPMMEKLAALYQYVHLAEFDPRKRIFRRIYVYFEENSMYLGMEMNHELFSFNELKNAEEEFKNLQKSILAELETVRQLLDFALSLY